MEDYKIEILINTEEVDVKNGIGKFARSLYERFYLEKGNLKVYSFSVEPFDRAKAEYKFIKDMDK